MNNDEQKFLALINTESFRVIAPIDPECYKMTVTEFIEVVEDARTNGITVLYLDGKLYYTYNN